MKELKIHSCFFLKGVQMERLVSTTIISDAFQRAGDDISLQISVVWDQRKAALSMLLQRLSDISIHFELVWDQIKTLLIVPLLQLAVIMCSIMALMLSIDIIYMAVMFFLVKIFRRKPEKLYKWEPMKDDVESGTTGYPVVLVQIPMYNEQEVYRLSIGAACGLSWPSDRIIIQVLDDSTDPTIKDLVELECRRWASEGINIKYEIRETLNGFKAGALKEGMKKSYLKNCDYVVIFDADFQPEPDFLCRTIPFLVHNPELALVQARWKFVNADESLMTRMQEMSLALHFTVEQEVGSSIYAFFAFNRTAGVWRISALNEVGGWKDRTTVEDMDLSVRAGLKGWKFVYIDSLEVKNELPSTLKAYRRQQYGWSCGPANLFRKISLEIITNKKVTLWKKVHVIYSFFLARKIVAPFVAFTFYCIVMPATAFVPEVHVPNWGALYILLIIILLSAISTPRSIHLIVFWLLFESVVSLQRIKAVFSGLLEAGSVNEWIVTKKLGDALKSEATTAPKEPGFRFRERLHLLEVGTGAYLFFCGCYALAIRKNYFLCQIAQAIAFFVVGLGYVGTFVPSS